MLNNLQACKHILLFSVCVCVCVSPTSGTLSSTRRQATSALCLCLNARWRSYIALQKVPQNDPPLSWKPLTTEKKQLWSPRAMFGFFLTLYILSTHFPTDEATAFPYRRRMLFSVMRCKSKPKTASASNPNLPIFGLFYVKMHCIQIQDESGHHQSWKLNDLVWNLSYLF